MSKRPRRRRAKELPPVNPLAKNKRNVVHLDSMPAPNHLASFDLSRVPGKKIKYQPQYPMLKLMLSEKGFGPPTGLAFVDSVYGVTDWRDRMQNDPPTWMDPEIFIRMALSLPEAEQFYEKVRSDPSDANRKKLQRFLEQVFEEYYLPYARSQFSKASRVVADWTVAHFATIDKTRK